MKTVFVTEARRLAAIMLLAAGGLLGACGEAPQDLPKPPAEAETGIYPASDYRAGERGRSGGTLRVAVAMDTGSLDLHAIAYGNAQWLGRLLFDNLVYLDEQGRPSPWLAKS